MKRSLLLPVGVLAAATLAGQYAGGVADGADRETAPGSTLAGGVGDVRVAFAGGPGDGHHRAQAAATPSGADPAPLFAGGRGDGHDAALAQVTPDGTSVDILYAGGPGDGHDAALTQTTPGGTALAVLYGGGAGDGHDADLVQTTPGGTALAVLYGGGAGDGHDAFVAQTTPGGTDLAALYSGGAGDGHDAAATQAVVDGAQLAALFGGGGGDGHDIALFTGGVPLPLTLLAFEALPRDGFVLLQWSTADERGTDYFTVERTRDAADYLDLGRTPAAGDAGPGEVIDYALRDDSPLAGTSYYRLRMVDLDGTATLSHLVEVTYDRRLA